MTLLDHFHPPLSLQRHWHAFHNAWATYIASYFNERLPAGYFAEPNVQFGIEIDIATFRENGSHHVADAGPAPLDDWLPPSPQQTLLLSTTTDIVEVRVFRQAGGPTLAGAVELVSPANKDRETHRDAFVQKCATYLREGLGLVVIDVVTSLHANLHSQILAAVAQANSPEDGLHVAAYHPVEREGQRELDVWLERLAVGAALPTLPLWLRGELCIRLDLQETYARTCREQRLSSP